LVPKNNADGELWREIVDGYDFEGEASNLTNLPRNKNFMT